MDLPHSVDLPFFAYGLFRPGQLAFFQLRELVSKVADPAEVAGSLLLRDGLPIIDPQGRGRVRGAFLRFVSERSAEAYARISAMEPEKHYCWQEVQVDGTSANLLAGRRPSKGSGSCEDAEWNGWTDPLFTAALEVVEQTLNSQDYDWDLKPLFRLQMAYLLLWSSIERYVSLRYHLADRVTEKIGRLAREPAFAEGLLRHVNNKRIVYRVDRPSDKEVLDRERPEKAIQYYYQLRSNITHRGKAAVRDYEMLKHSLTELLAIFREVLKVAERDAGYSG